MKRKALLLFNIWLWVCIINAQDNTQNYVHTRTMLNKEGTQYIDNIQYFDGLGRPVQTVQKGVTPNGADLVTYQQYDNFGREKESWLPVPIAGNNGGFAQLSTVEQQSRTFYLDANAYSLPGYENSPLNRVLSQTGPGQRWHNSGSAVQTAYLTNTESGILSCKWYRTTDERDVNSISIGSQTVALSSDGKKLSSNGTVLTTRTSECYPPGELFVTKSTDEDGNDSYEFKDKLGQVLLTRQMERDIMHDTYYIYDSFGNLRAVLPPLASDLVRIVTNQCDTTNKALADYAYLYKYDYRNRCIEKKLPGCDPIVYKYDYGDRLIFTQDGEMKEKGVWMFSIPDVFGRVVLTGTTTQAPDVSDMVVKATRNGSHKGYSSSISLTNTEIHTVNYYDDYSFVSNLSAYSAALDDTDYEETLDYGSWYATSQKGLLTGTLTAQFTDEGISNEYLCTVMYYDERGRVVQTKSNNHLGGMEKEYIAYNFIGQPKKRMLVHSGNEDITQVYDYDYDHAGRLKFVKHSVNGNPSITLAANDYDELGRIEKTIQGDNANLDNNYRYNIRSWLETKSGHQFNTALEYGYTGNISSMEWEQNNKLREYVYDYDGLSRLLSASFTENADGERYSTNYKYDKHGNILSLRREGKADTCYATVDSLAIRYQGNQMTRVTDNGMTVSLPESNAFEQGSTKSIQYAYNKNGAMTMDLNKKITDISYNILNLPNKLVIDSITHSYTYAADGRKLRVQQDEDKRDYVGSIIYEDSSLKRILVDGGYAEKEGNSWIYYFYFNDHLGNNVVVADQDGNPVQNNSYYPFGLPMATASDSIQGLQSYKYNGKEFERKDGLNWMDYGARHYDVQVGRFTTVDPLAEKYYSVSPYAYCNNNPMRNVDLRGDTITTIINTVVTNPDGTTSIQHNTYQYKQDVNGNYGFVDANGQMYSGSDQFVVNLTSALNSLQTGGSAGKSLVNNLMNNSKSVEIVKGRNTADSNGSFIKWNPNSTTGGMNENGTETRPSYIGLGHEMAHIQDIWNGTVDNSAWVTVNGINIPKSEQYATHVENLIRSENKVPLRTHYGIDASSGTRLGLESTRIIQQGTRSSIYFTYPMSILPVPFVY